MNKIFNLMLLTSLITGFRPVFAEECSILAGKNSLNQGCIEKWRQQAVLKTVSGDLKIEVYGKDQAILIRRMDPLSEKMIMGDRTRLARVSALALDEKNREVIVFDSSKNQVFVFELTNSGGNLVPLRSFPVAEVKSICVDEETNQLLVANSNSIRIYRRLANQESKKSVSKVDALKTFHFAPDVIAIEKISCLSGGAVEVTGNGKTQRVNLQTGALETGSSF